MAELTIASYNIHWGLGPRGRKFPPFDAVEDGIDLLVRHRVGTAELGVEIGAVLGHLGQRVVDLVIDNEFLVAEVLHRDPGPLAEGHFPIAVEGAAWVHAHG